MLTKGSNLTRRSFKIILLGESGVGKTCIIERFIQDQFDPERNVSLLPTIGIDFLGKTITHKGLSCRLQLWDSAGQQKYMSLIPSYLKDADCVLFVFDVNKPSSLEGLERWIRLYKDNQQRKSISIICGNKSDLGKHVDKNRLSQMMEKYKMPFHSISAKSGENIVQLFYLIIDMTLIASKKDENLKVKRREEAQEDDLESVPTEGGMVSNIDQKLKINSKKQEESCFKKRCPC